MVEPNTDILDGYAEIGAFLKMTEKQAKHRALALEIPTYTIGRRRYSRKSTLLAWMAEQEAASRRDAAGSSASA